MRKLWSEHFLLCYIAVVATLALIAQYAPPPWDWF